MMVPSASFGGRRIQLTWQRNRSLDSSARWQMGPIFWHKSPHTFYMYTNWMHAAFNVCECNKRNCIASAVQWQMHPICCHQCPHTFYMHNNNSVFLMNNECVQHITLVLYWWKESLSIVSEVFYVLMKCVSMSVKCFKMERVFIYCQWSFVKWKDGLSIVS